MITRVLALALGLFALISMAATSPSSGREASGPVTVPDALLMTGMPGTSVSSSFLVHVSNSTQSLSILVTTATLLQDDAGHQIPASSVSLTPQTFTIEANHFATIGATVLIPSDATTGNYSGKIIYLAENGSTTTTTLSVLVTAPYVGYGISYVFILAGVIVSFIYSPLRDPKPTQQQIAMLGPLPRWIGLRKDNRRNHFAVIIASFTLSFLAFAYLLSSTTNLWAFPLRDLATAFTSGLAAHRTIDGVAPKLFD